MFIQVILYSGCFFKNKMRKKKNNPDLNRPTYILSIDLVGLKISVVKSPNKQVIFLSGI